MASIVGNTNKGYTDSHTNYTPPKSKYDEMYKYEEWTKRIEKYPETQPLYNKLMEERAAAYDKYQQEQRAMFEKQKLAREEAVRGQLGRQMAYDQLGREPNRESWFRRMFPGRDGINLLPINAGLMNTTYPQQAYTNPIYGNPPPVSTAPLNYQNNETQLSREERLNILRENRRGYQVGMPGLDFVQNPQVLGDPTEPEWLYKEGPEMLYLPPYDGYGGWGGYGGYGGGGWNYPKYNTSQDASKWYNTMVQWNIGNKQA